MKIITINELITEALLKNANSKITLDQSQYPVILEEMEKLLDRSEDERLKIL